jgi:hypothetical protein
LLNFRDCTPKRTDRGAIELLNSKSNCLYLLIFNWRKSLW